VTSYLNPQIIYEDDCLLVINKPSGLIVNRAQTTRNQVTLQDWLEKKFSFNEPKSSSFAARSGIVHRLDKDTSGLILIAKDASSYSDLQLQFKKRRVKKTYQGLVHGLLRPAEGGIDLPVSRNPVNPQKFGVFYPGKKAKTTYLLDRKFARNKVSCKKILSFLKIYPYTGRTHQIRVHFKYLKHPIVSDPIYGGRKTFRQDKKWCPRLFLHASKIEFFHPETKNKISFSCELPPVLKAVLSELFLV
jgi:23S rRNA pseudouridine1911/1915/1917 synthase